MDPYDVNLLLLIVAAAFGYRVGSDVMLTVMECFRV